ncbi:MAG: hypothetical protein R3D69_07090 [Xanthobacteraceae bacterium]
MKSIYRKLNISSRAEAAQGSGPARVGSGAP